MRRVARLARTAFPLSRLCSITLSLAMCVAPAVAQPAREDISADSRSARMQEPIDSRTPGQRTGATVVGDRQLLWGDAHLHTMNSADAYGNGTANADIETAYRHARGFPVIHPRTGRTIRIDRPLDFLVVADHAEMLSVAPRLRDRDPLVLATAEARKLLALFLTDSAKAMSLMQKFDPNVENSQIIKDLHAPAIRQAGWDAQVDAAERHNQPGTFTAMIGWEWSSTPNVINLHRVVLTSADGQTAKKFLPLANYDTMRPEELWRFLRETSVRTGAEFIAIPHNSNLSNGLMFGLTDSDGRPFDAAYARERMTWEPVVEITQYKGTSETHASLSPRDEFADFEIRNHLLDGRPLKHAPGSYVRSALKAGLAEESRIGVNPFAFGIIGSTDSHSGFVSTLEADFLGKAGDDVLAAERASGKSGIYGSWGMSAGGLAAAWADRNDRRGVFDAFKRREVYATSGTRIALRLFAGYSFVAGDDKARDFGALGYRKGVPMGGQLARSRRGAAPALVIRAVKDPHGANLDRVQVVKGWRDAMGSVHEKVFDVAWSGDRRIGQDGRLPPVGNTVEVASASYQNTIGAAELTAFWRDPQFDPDEAAFYYVRVLEIPTPRHHVFDAAALRMDVARIEQRPVIQERAFSSPIWYHP